MAAGNGQRGARLTSSQSFSLPPQTNGLFSQPSTTQSSRPEVPEAPAPDIDMAFIRSQEDSSKDELIDMLSSKVTKLTLALERSKTCETAMRETMQDLERRSEVHRRDAYMLQEGLAAQEEKVVGMREQIAAQESVNEDLRRMLHQGQVQQDRLAAKLKEEEARSREAERVVDRERGIVMEYLRGAGYDDKVQNMPPSEQSAAILVEEVSALGEALAGKQRQLEDASQRVVELLDEVEMERGWREAAQKERGGVDVKVEGMKTKFSQARCLMDRAEKDKIALVDKLRAAESKAEEARKETQTLKAKIAKQKAQATRNALAEHKAGGLVSGRLKEAEEEIARLAEELVVQKQAGEERAKQAEAAKAAKRTIAKLKLQLLEAEQKLSQSGLGRERGGGLWA